MTSGDTPEPGSGLATVSPILEVDTWRDGETIPSSRSSGA